VKIGRQRDVERATRGISENNTLISRHTKIFFLVTPHPLLSISLSLFRFSPHLKIASPYSIILLLTEKHIAIEEAGVSSWALRKKNRRGESFKP
jgi:hypothetical protein